MDLRRFCIISLLAPVAACAMAPKERYLVALNARLDGDAAAYREQLLELAAAAPDSRAGRRARAILGPNNLMQTAVLAAALANLGGTGLGSLLPTGGGDEPEKFLHDIRAAQNRHFESSGRYCEQFLECELVPEAELHYLYMMSFQEAVGGTGGVERDLFLLQVDRQLAGMGIQPQVGQNGFLILAVANLDSDPELDVWALDDEGTIVQLVDDRR